MNDTLFYIDSLKGANALLSSLLFNHCNLTTQTHICNNALTFLENFCAHNKSNDVNSGK